MTASYSGKKWAGKWECDIQTDGVRVLALAGGRGHMPTFGLAQLDLLAQTSTVEHAAVKQDLSHHPVFSADKDPQTPQSNKSISVRPVSLSEEILS